MWMWFPFVCAGVKESAARWICPDLVCRRRADVTKSYTPHTMVLFPPSTPSIATLRINKHRATPCFVYLNTGFFFFSGRPPPRPQTHARKKNIVKPATNERKVGPAHTYLTPHPPISKDGATAAAIPGFAREATGVLRIVHMHHRF